MTDADLTARLDRIDGRLDRMVDVLDAQTKLILALDARVDALGARMDTGFAALNSRVGRLSETLMRGFTWRDEQMQEILARVEALEERIQSERGAP